MKSPWLILLIAAIICISIWDGAWKLVAMWKSARRNQIGWYVCLAIFNTAGILPIIYLLAFQPPAPPQPPGRA
jgi:hypothetical protein